MLLVLFLIKCYQHKNPLWAAFLSAVLNIAYIIIQHHLQVCSFSRHIVHILQRAGCWGPAGLLPHLTSPLSLSTDTRLTSSRVWSSAAAGAHKIQTLQQDTSLSLQPRYAVLRPHQCQCRAPVDTIKGERWATKFRESVHNFRSRSLYHGYHSFFKYCGNFREISFTPLLRDSGSFWVRASRETKDYNELNFCGKVL